MQIKDFLEQPNCYLIKREDEHYPSQLREIANPPAQLFVMGNLQALITPQIAIVGSRQSSRYGQQLSFDFARELSQLGFTITSGLAQGIDTQAHLGAIHAHRPTIAVMGTGLDIIYPRQNKNLAEKILAGGGALVSEFSPQTPPKPENFPQRNRIISGLSIGVVVIEASLKSGSLITARLANEQGREVFALPHPLSHPQGQGCHHLVQQGAKLVTKIEDIIEEFPYLYMQDTKTPVGWINSTAGTRSRPSGRSRFKMPEAFCSSHRLRNPSRNKEYPLAKQKENLLALLRSGVKAIETLVAYSGLSAQETTATLAELELIGIVVNTAQGYELAAIPADI